MTESKGFIDAANAFINLSKSVFIAGIHRSKSISRIKKVIPGKMKCGLVFQHLPESIHMVRRYEIIGEDCKKNIEKLIKSARWG